MDYSDLLPLVLLPLMSALIGWLTNKLALLMLFRPRTERNFIVFRLQGLIPRRQDEMASAIAETVSTHLVNRDAVQKELTRPRVRSALVDGLVEYGRKYVADTVAALPRPVRIVVPDAVQRKLNRKLRREAEKHLPVLMDEISPAIAANVDFRRRIRTEIAAYPHQRLESMIRTIAGRELRSIEIWGAVLGFLVGLLQTAVVFLFMR
ncbi:MAG: DUF445 family protein [Planctomycetes bacterium]|nr:DUF445 family protein [Planctomycetota bacterium]